MNFCARQDGDGTVTIYSMRQRRVRGELPRLSIAPICLPRGQALLADIFPRQRLRRAGGRKPVFWRRI